MLHSGNVTLANSNPTPLIAQIATPGAKQYGSVYAAFVIIENPVGASGPITVTGIDPSTGNAQTAGIVLAAGEKTTLPWYGPPHSYNLAETYVTGTAAQVVNFVYGN